MMRTLLVLLFVATLMGCGEDDPTICDCVNNLEDKKLQDKCAELYYRKDISDADKAKYFKAAQKCEGSSTKENLDHNYMEYPSPCDCKRLSEAEDVQQLCAQKFKLESMTEAEAKAWEEEQAKCPEYK
jgi:hypothetical protein